MIMSINDWKASQNSQALPNKNSKKVRSKGNYLNAIVFWPKFNNKL